jgi:hypothetical protein
MAGGAHKGYRRSGVVFRLESCEHYLPCTLRLLAGNRLEMRQGLIVGSEDRETPIVFMGLKLANPHFGIAGIGS